MMLLFFRNLQSNIFCFLLIPVTYYQYQTYEKEGLYLNLISFYAFLTNILNFIFFGIMLDKYELFGYCF